MDKQAGLALAVGHLNASVGQLLSPEELADALRAGSTQHLSLSPLAKALISSLFVELSPQLILQCAREAGADMEKVQQLYQQTLAEALPPARDWESAVEHLL